MIEYIKKNKHCLLLLFWAVDGVWYTVLQAVTMDRNPVSVHIFLDEMIPFCEWFIIPYVLWYFYIVAVTLYMLFKSKEGFIKLYAFMIPGMLLCLVLCTLYPMWFDRSSAAGLYANDNLLTSFCKALQGFDNPTTIMPSIHVYVSVALTIAFIKYGTHKKLHNIASVILCVSICFSTVFVKQHSALDGIVALAFAVPMYFIVFGRRKK